MSLKQQQRKSLAQIALVPIWCHIKAGGERQMKPSKNSSRSLSSRAPSGSDVQTKLEKLYHGDPEKEDSLSYISQFFKLKGKYSNLIESKDEKDYTRGCGGVEKTQVNDKDGISKSKEKVFLNTAVILGEDKKIFLSDTKVQLSLRSKNASGRQSNGGVSMFHGAQMMNMMKSLEKCVQKFLAYEKNFTKNNQLPSGTNAEECLNSILDEAWRVQEYEKNSRNDCDGSEGDETEGDSITEVTVLEANIAPPQDYVSATERDESWRPDGWGAYVLYVCQFTRVTEQYLPYFHYDAAAIDSNAVSRKNVKGSSTKVKKEDQSFINDDDSVGTFSSLAEKITRSTQQKDLQTKSMLVVNSTAGNESYVEQLRKQVQDKFEQMKQFYEMKDNATADILKADYLRLNSELFAATDNLKNSIGHMNNFTESVIQKEKGRPFIEFDSESLRTPKKSRSQNDAHDETPKSSGRSK
ncbi:predicted protein [Chaetoceros tenuissimus]|uniref:Uncharacterized protein n=1 Tax=Chaetoceros tenuissimus TaxID=426638 RepID=A0AAD3CQ94_9STRA|nr:predicted protein [Chaetoceros tenuissimus]